MADRTYEVRVNGLVPTEELLEQLRDVRVAEHEYRTVLSGRFLDQAELYGFLNLLRSYGLEIVEVRRVPIATAETDELEAHREGENR
jgi:hypothetical protein